MGLKTIFFSIVLILSLIVFIINLKRIISYLKLARKEIRWDNIANRLINTIKIAFFQSKIFRESIAGPLHAIIFWGFLVFLFSASEAILQGFVYNFTWSFLGPIYTAITFSTDIFSILIIIAVIVAFIRRFVIKVKRLQGDKIERLDAIIVLSMIFIIVCSLLLENSAGLLLYEKQAWCFKPISEFLSKAINFDNPKFFYELFWWLHIGFILIFANYLPYSKHFHVYSSIPNVFFYDEKKAKTLERINFEDETIEKFGVEDIQDFTWKNLFDSYTCTHCGRCTSVCPANQTGKELDPRQIMIEIRRRVTDYAPILLKQQKASNETDHLLTDKEKTIIGKKFIGDYESIEALWQCTTCGSCMQECPVMIEHVPAIVNMRRSLVMMESNFPTLLQSAFSNMENNSAPWAFSQMERADWAIGKNIRLASECQSFEYLFWVGCAGSFDERAKKISIAFSELLNIAGVDFAILGTEEYCNGDVARRTGNEYLADMLIKMNIDTLKKYNVQKILTICPHCYNTLKNDYPSFGGEFEVFHHSEFLYNLIEQGKLKIENSNFKNKRIVYHDSCYLGRYNNIYNEPRKIINSIPEANLIETRRNKDKGFCCGAGGGQMFMEETVGKRVNIERTEELIEKYPDIIALNCPFCMTMISDGLKTKDIEQIQVKDVAEIIIESLQSL